MEQGDTEVFLQCSQGLTHRRLRSQESLSRGRDAPFLGNDQEGAQLVEVHKKIFRFSKEI
jgi:hypothetical protein